MYALPTIIHHIFISIAIDMISIIKMWVDYVNETTIIRRFEPENQSDNAQNIGPVEFRILSSNFAGFHYFFIITRTSCMGDFYIISRHQFVHIWYSIYSIEYSAM